MPRRKKSPDQAAPAEITAEAAPQEATAISAAEPEATPAQLTPVPAWIDGPQTVAEAPAEGPANPEAKNWGDPYKAIFTSTEKGFEMGENRRFKQRVFRFTEKPGEELIAKLKESGFTYRASEKAWTIQANPDTRKLSDELAHEFAGQSREMNR